MLYFDTHAHYDFKEFDKDRKQLLEKLKNSVSAIINVGINPESCIEIIKYSKDYNYCFSAIGIHPQEVGNSIPIEEIEKIYKENNFDKKIIAIGETGLDYHFDYPINLQKEYFIKHIELANKYKLPIIIHARESHEDVLNILSENEVVKSGVMHCYSGPSNMVNQFLDIGFYISFGGPLTRYDDIQEALKKVPLDKILIETDAPLLPPLPFEKKDRNDSKNLNKVVEKIAEIKNITLEEVVKITTDNACRLFNINNKDLNIV